MFYGKNNPNSQLLAQSIQDNIVNMLQPENTRAIKKGESNLVNKDGGDKTLTVNCNNGNIDIDFMK